MKVDGWKYYNHAAIPTCAPHEMPDIAPVLNGSLWEGLYGGKPLFARWTTDFNCVNETGWWWMIRFAPFIFEDLPKSSRKKVRKGLNKCTIKRISAEHNKEALFEVYNAAFDKYQNADSRKDYASFCQVLDNLELNECDFWGGYDNETNRLIGYMVVQSHHAYAELLISRFMPQYLKQCISAALYYSVLDCYLNQRGKQYISSGSRSINHKTNTEDYKISAFGYKRVFCKLQICYSPLMKIAVKMLYPFRNLLHLLDGITIIHQINAVLKMEEIVRDEKL